MSLFNNPLSIEKADRLISVMDVAENSRVLDAGCGCGEFLIRVIESANARGLGIDIDSSSISTARQNALGRIPEASCEFLDEDIQTTLLEESSFDLAVCIGSTHAYGSGDAAYSNTLSALARLVKPGGMILIGEGYWKQDPDPDYLQLIGEPVGIYRNYAANISFAEGQGLLPLYATVSNDDEWDHFEWTHKMNIERQAILHAGDPKWAERLKRARRWRDGYLRWGRMTMGFGFYLFTNPPGLANQSNHFSTAQPEEVSE